MKAMVFAAGLGTRLRPLTDNKPKALVEVGGKPMLERVIRHLISCGFTDVTINVHHFGQQIIDFVNANNCFGIDLHISDERNLLLDTGGGIRHARPFLDGNEPFLVHNADILTDIDLRDLYNHHLANNAYATMLTAERPTSRYLIFDADNTMHGWTNVKTGEVRPEGFCYDRQQYHQAAYSGIQVVSPAVFADLDAYALSMESDVIPIIPFYLSECNRRKIVSYQPSQSYHWIDIGKPETLAEANRLIHQM